MLSSQREVKHQNIKKWKCNHSQCSSSRSGTKQLNMAVLTSVDKAGSVSSIDFIITMIVVQK